MITRAKFQNFKALRDVEVTFDSRLTVIVGPNGSGKTSILQGIQHLCQPISDPASIGALLQKVTPFVSTFGTLSEFALEAAFSHPLVNVDEGTVQIFPTEKVDSKSPVRWSHPLSYQMALTTGQGTTSSINQPLKTGPGFPPAASLLRLDTAALLATTQPEQMPPSVQPDGAGLAATLGYLALNQPKRFRAIVEEFRQIIHNVEEVRFDEHKAGGGAAKSLIFDFRGASDVRASHVSNGTLYTLGLLTVIHGPRRPAIILLDDVDHGLHPKAQINLVELLRTILKQYPDLQILATSHSPFILDQLQWNEVRVTALQDDGSAICKPLTDHPDFERWKDAMSPGEFWSTFYEDWLTKNRTPQTVP